TCRNSSVPTNFKSSTETTNNAATPPSTSQRKRSTHSSALAYARRTAENQPPSSCIAAAEVRRLWSGSDFWAGTFEGRPLRKNLAAQTGTKVVASKRLVQIAKITLMARGVNGN